MEKNARPPTIVERMKHVRKACAEAPAGETKNAAQAHYLAAKQAHRERLEQECNRHLDAAQRALA